MKTKRFAHLLSVLLVAALLCGLFPAAYAEETREDLIAGKTQTAAEEPALSREDTILAFLKLVMQAEHESDPVARAALCKQAKELWNSYLETAPAGSTQYADELEHDAAKPERQDLLFDLMQYIMAAETENDPAARASLYLQADAIWYSYLDLVNGAAAEAESKLDPEQEKALQDLLLGMADPDMSPEEQARFLEEAGKLWDTYYGMVIDAMEANKPSPAEAAEPETPAEPEKPETPETPAESEEPDSDSFYADSWEELEDMLHGMMGSFSPFSEDMAPFGFPNPWIDTDWLEQAILISGIKLTPPEKQALPEGMKLYGYCAMDGTIEADYSDGENELMLRASLIDEGYTLSGDYNNYSKEWTEKFGDVEVSCLGDGKTVNVASWQSGDVAFAVTMACGLEGQGLTVAELEALVKGTEAEPVRDGNPTDIYANRRDIFADPVRPATAKDDAQSETDTQDSEATHGTGSDRKPSSFGRRRASQFDFDTFMN